MKPTGKNDFGLDARYFHEKLSLIVRDIDHYTPDEMYRILTRLADVVKPAQEPSESDIFKKNLKGVATTSPIPKDWELVSAPAFVNVPAQEPVQENTCPQCGVRSGNGHCLGDIFNCSDMTSKSKE